MQQKAFPVIAAKIQELISPSLSEVNTAALLAREGYLNFYSFGKQVLKNSAKCISQEVVKS